jgi:hypothetical protein
MSAVLLVSATVVAYFAAAVLVKWLFAEMHLPPSLEWMDSHPSPRHAHAGPGH